MSDARPEPGLWLTVFRVSVITRGEQPADADDLMVEIVGHSDEVAMEIVGHAGTELTARTAAYMAASWGQPMDDDTQGAS